MTERSFCNFDGMEMPYTFRTAPWRFGMNEIDFLNQEIFTRYGSVTRARGSFLYTAKNVRLTDMYQENGRAILGWGGGSAFTMLKNALNRGLTGSFRTDFSYRLQKAVSTLLNSKRKTFIFNDKMLAMKSALSVSPEGTSVYKPWSGAQIDWSKIDAVIMEPPLPWTSGIFILAVNETPDMEQKLSNLADSFKTSYLPSPLEAAATRSIYNLIKAMQERKEEDWFIYDKVLTKYWTRKGPYLFIKKDVVPEDCFKDFVKHCLDCTLVINPVYNEPSIIPFGADPGVFSKLSKNPWEGKK